MNDSIKSLPPIRIFIGSSPANTIEEKVLRYTLQKYTDSPLEIHVIDGTTGSAINLTTNEVQQLPTNVIANIQGATAFSLARWAIPEWCGYAGKAIYCDSDQVVLADILELWNFDLSESILAAVPISKAKSSKQYIKSVLNHYLNSDGEYYLASVMLIDCSRAAVWSMESLLDLLDKQQFSRQDLMYLGPGFRDYFSLSIKDLVSEWNHLDCADNTSKLVHFTEIPSQPWLFPDNPIGDIWENCFLETVDQGFLTKDEIKQAHQQQSISLRIKAFTLMPKLIRKPINDIWKTGDNWMRVFKALVRRFGQRIKSITRQFKSELLSR
jgi:lipopolysaccharide biosynthesis glycosyltransferase